MFIAPRVLVLCDQCLSAILKYYLSVRVSMVWLALEALLETKDLL